MSTLVSSTDIALDLTRHTVTGSITIGQIREAIDTFYQGSPTKLVLWDFTGADFNQVSEADLRELAQFTAQYRGYRPGGKTALLVDQLEAYRLGILFEISTSFVDSGVEFRTFSERESALDWLGIGGGKGVGAPNKAF